MLPWQTSAIDASAAMVVTGGGGIGIAPTVDTPSIQVALTDINNFTTTNNNAIIIICISYNVISGGTLPTVSSVTNIVGTGLTWASLDSSLASVTSAASGTPKVACEIWWTLAPTSGNQGTIHVTMTGAVDNISLIVFAVDGVGNTTTPYDSNGSLPATGTDTGAGGATTPTINGISTTTPGTLVIQVVNSANTAGAVPDQSQGTIGGQTATFIGNSPNNNGTNFSKSAAQVRAFTTAQTGISAAFGGTETGWASVVHALIGT